MLVRFFTGRGSLRAACVAIVTVSRGIYRLVRTVELDRRISERAYCPKVMD